MTDQTDPILHVVLHSPEIPPNTGNIGRSCVAIGAKLWLVKPLGYLLDDKYLRRAGMDYWQFLNYEVVENWEELRQRIGEEKQYWYLTKFATKLVWEAEFTPGDVLVFGSEGSGLPSEIRDENPDSCLKLPMYEEVRSLNLASTANTVVYEAIRQFGGLSNS
ncbi:tRNA (cytidine(34)-2'-O)-methyltransferase [Thalassoglobus sp.]|uniref:tRNA (cytidine(34)-2'-O)-methyltransferase n=1 Tax=Thalassoglobus sp. TaxID=2795869 RepID=UPI003AA92A36